MRPFSFAFVAIFERAIRNIRRRRVFGVSYANPRMAIAFWVRRPNRCDDDKMPAAAAPSDADSDGDALIQLLTNFVER